MNCLQGKGNSPNNVTSRLGFEVSAFGQNRSDRHGFEILEHKELEFFVFDGLKTADQKWRRKENVGVGRSLETWPILLTVVTGYKIQNNRMASLLVTSSKSDASGPSRVIEET